MKKMTLILFGAFVFAFTALAATWTDPDTGITWTYTVSDGKASVGGGYSAQAVSKSTTGTIAIPSTLGGCPVTSIGDYAFYNCKGLTSVTIPEGVTSVGYCAFYGCKGLTNVTIPEGVTNIGACAFYGCSGLTSVEIPNSVTSMGEKAFSDCSGLTSVTIASSVTSIGDYSFFGCSGLMSFDVDTGNPNYKSVNGLLLSKDGKMLISGVNGNVTVPKGVTSISDYAFYNCNGLTRVIIPEGVTNIGTCAFSGCSGLTCIGIPEGVTSIGYEAFQNCSGIRSVAIPSSVTSIGGSAFYGCSGLTSVTIPEGVTSIGGNAFRKCSGLTCVKIPSGVTIIDCYAFFGCSGLTSVTIPKGVTSICNYAFGGCSGLTSVTIPSSVTSISGYAFWGCSGLSSVTIPSSVTSIGDKAFDYCNSIRRVVVPGWKCGINFASVTNLIISEGTTSIGYEAFRGCSGLTSVTIPSSVTSIGFLAFCGCSGLTSVEMSEGVTSIGYNAFSSCSGLTNIAIPSSVTNISGYAFSGCNSLDRLVVSEQCEVADSAIPSGCVLARYVSARVYTSGEVADYYDGLVKFPNWTIDGPSGCIYVGEGAVDAGEYRFWYSQGDFTCTNEAYEVDFYLWKDDFTDLTIYRRNAAVTALSATKAYDGTSLTAGYEVGGMGFVDGECEVCVTASQTCVGVVTNAVQLNWMGNGKPSNYNLAITNGLLTVTARPVNVTAQSAEKVYDGSTLTAGVEVGGMGFVDGECEVCVTASQTCAGVMTNAVQLNWIGNGKPSNYNLLITNGLLTVTARPVSVTAYDAVKVYDGAPLTAGMEIGGMGFVDGECEVSATGSQTCVGSSENGVQLNWIGNGKASNYDLTITNGTLTVLPAEVSQDGEEPWGGDEPRPYVGGEGVVSLYSAVNMYDGKGHTIDFETLSKIKLVGGDAPQISYSLTSNGVYQTEPIFFTNVCCTSIWYKVESANHKPYIHEAGIDILARQVEITSGSAEKKYDGTPLVCHDCTIGGDGFVEGEGVVIEYTGSQTLLGTSDNTFDYTFAEGTSADNYVIDKINGSLTVTYAGKFDEVPQVIEQEFSGGSSTVHFAPVGEGVTIHYTTDGSVPTSASATYDGEIVVTDTTRIRAIASKYGWTDSDETDVTVHCTSGIVDGDYASVAERYPNAYATITNVTVCGKAKLTAEFFAGCVALRTVALGDDLQSIDCDAFDAMPDFEWEIVDGYKYCSNWLFGYTDDAVESLTHTDTLKGVANGALEGCTAIHYFTCEVGSELKHIGNAAFKECVKLERVLLPEGVADIGDEAFYGCTKMANFIIPGTVKTIGASAFKRCTSLTGALFGYGIESIGDEAFYGDWRIAEVDIPSTVTNIGSNAFGGDSSIIRAGLRCDIGKKISDIFSHYANIREITVKEGDGEIPDWCFQECGELDAVRYLGNCPVLENAGTNLYCTGTNTWLVSYVTQGSTGWDGVKASEALPQAWPLVGNCRRAIAFWDQPTYLCQFDSNGGTLGVQDTYQYSEKNVVLPPEPVQSGYKFAGWWTQPIGGLRVTSDTIFIEGVYTYLYAHWIKGHWVFLDPNGGEVVNDFITYVEESTYGVLPMPVRSGYAFGGWLYDGRVIEPETEINEKADHTLVAQWTANLYSVRYNPNGGVGDEETQGYVYGVEQALRKNTYTRSGYTFVGWSTNTTDEAVYRDCETVSNLTAVADGFVELYAVWEEGAIVDPTNVSFTFGGDENWTKCYEGVVVTNAGEEFRYDTIWKSGAITHNQSSVLKATVNGPGTISFWWKVSCEAFRQYKLDYLELAIDGVPCEPWINGETEWVHVEFDVDQSGEHVLTWTYAKDKEGTMGEDCGRVCAVVWTPRLETIADYLNSTNLTFTTSGDAVWSGDVATNHDGVASLKSGAIGDGCRSIVETTVDGSGKMSFWWKVSSEAFRNYQVDYIACYVDGAEKAWMGGEIDWTNICIAVEGEGSHTVEWIYQKDSYADSHDGDDCAWLDQIVWESMAKADPIPEIDGGATPQEVAEALGGSADGKLAVCITNVATYNAYREWADSVKVANGTETAGSQAVKDSPNAWVSFALGSDKLLENAPTDEDLTVEEFEPSGEAGKFDFTVSVDGVEVGSEAQKENLKQVFGLEGATTLEPDAFSSGNVDLTFGTPENGKVKFTAGPKNTSAGTFFMKVKMTP